MHRRGVFARDPWRCRFAECPELGSCAGRLQADHILKIQALRRWQGQLHHRAIKGEALSAGQLRFSRTPLEELIADPRNGWILCWLGHHIPKDRGEIPTEQLLNRWPVDFLDFIDYFDLGDLIDSEFGSGSVVRLPGHGSEDSSPFTDWID